MARLEGWNGRPGVGGFLGGFFFVAQQTLPRFFSSWCQICRSEIILGDEEGREREVKMRGGRGGQRDDLITLGVVQNAK